MGNNRFKKFKITTLRIYVDLSTIFLLEADRGSASSHEICKVICSRLSCKEIPSRG